MIQIVQLLLHLLNYADGEKRICDSSKRTRCRTNYISGKVLLLRLEMQCMLSEIPLGTTFHCIELHPGQGAVMARSAGSLRN